jgi:hypothetical protein
VAKVRRIAEGIVRAKATLRRRYILFCRGATYGMSLLAAFSGAGLSVGSALAAFGVTPSPQSIYTVGVVGFLCSIASVAWMWFYNHFKVERTAADAVSAGDQFKDLEDALEEALAEPNPTDQLNQVLATHDLLWRSFRKLLKPFDEDPTTRDDIDQERDALVTDLSQRFHNNLQRSAPESRQSVKRR